MGSSEHARCPSATGWLHNRGYIAALCIASKSVFAELSYIKKSLARLAPARIRQDGLYRHTALYIRTLQRNFIFFILKTDGTGGTVVHYFAFNPLACTATVPGVFNQ